MSSPRCEVCNFGRTHRGYSMIQCSDCKIWVHQECYFDSVKFEAFEKSGTFVCFACQAVGHTVEAVETHWSSDYKKVKQTSRPMRCELCSVSNVVTAMHPLYDYHGEGGRQIYRKFKDKGNSSGYRLAWGHSICCYFLSRDGFLYGLPYVDGDGPDEARVIDTRKPNPSSIISKKFKKVLKDEGKTANTGFRYYLPDDTTDKMDIYRRSIAQYKNGIKCVFCGKLDKGKDYILRIPQQCAARSKGEIDWDGNGKKQVYKDLAGKSSCVAGMHIGCARWAQPNPKNAQHVPGHADACMYCTKHAEEVASKIKANNSTKRKSDSSPPPHPIAKKQKGEKKKSSLTSQQETEMLSGAAIHTSEKNRSASTAQKKPETTKRLVASTGMQTTSGNSSANTSNPVQKRNGKPPVASSATQSTVGRNGQQVSNNKTPSVPKKRKSPGVDLETLPAPNPNPKKKQKSAPDASERAKVWTSKPPAATSDAPHVRRGSFWQMQARKPKDRYAELDATQATAVNAGERPTLSKKRKELAAQKSKITDEKTQLILDDLLELAKGEDIDALKDAIKSRKRHFKRQFTELTTEDFLVIWKEARRQFLVMRVNKHKNPDSKVASQGVVDLSSEARNDRDESTGSSSGPAVNDKDEQKEKGTTLAEKPRALTNRWSKYFLGPDFQLGNEFTMDKFEELW
ncbi:MAG: hypothetical protein SGILL_003126 [Bacillariaceae sp.]